MHKYQIIYMLLSPCVAKGHNVQSKDKNKRFMVYLYKFLSVHF